MQSILPGETGSMEKLLKKPNKIGPIRPVGRFEKFNLTENPFPSQPFVNKDASDNRINGKIFEMEIREKEYEQIEKCFLKIPQYDPNHLRIGYIIDTSYVGRGNGKSAFLINLLEKINNEFCLDISEGANKCFSVYLDPELGGRTKTFDKFINLFFEAIISSNIINNCLASLRLEAILALNPDFNISECFKDQGEIVEGLNSDDWFQKNNISLSEISGKILQNEYLQSLPKDFPFYANLRGLFRSIETQEDFKAYYIQLKRNKERLEFIFSHLVDFFRAASFNGAFVLVDDFERIPDFQSARQKRDFALELRSCLFDGSYTNAKIGFYNILLVLHAGVPRLIQEAWSDSGMENRAPISPSQSSPKHIIPFEKLTRDHAKLLVKKYLSEYRKDKQKIDDLFPFQEEGVYKIAELSELNASKILKMSYDLMDRAATIPEQKIIDKNFITSIDEKNVFEDKPDKSIAASATADLLEKAKEQNRQ